jgi:hypothetical protein
VFIGCLSRCRVSSGENGPGVAVVKQGAGHRYRLFSELHFDISPRSHEGTKKCLRRGVRFIEMFRESSWLRDFVVKKRHFHQSDAAINPRRNATDSCEPPAHLPSTPEATILR